MSETQSTQQNMFGRRMIYVDTDIITAENIRDVLNKVLPTFHINMSDTDYLYRYYKGEQPILRREKKIRPEINNKIVENHAHEIVSFKTSYLCGEPITYARRAANKNASDTDADEGDDTSRLIAQLNEIMFVIGKQKADKDLLEWAHICGTSYRYCIDDDENGIQIGTLDPRTVTICYSRGLGNSPVMSLQEIRLEGKPPFYECYTDCAKFTVYPDRIDTEPHTYGAIPIVEYPANNARLGAFEIVLSLLDAINTVSSNRIDGTEQQIQSFLRCVNVRIDETTWQNLREEGLLQFQSDGSNPSSVDFLTEELDQSQTQIEINHLYQQALIICGMPDRNGANRTTGDTGQAVILRDGWTSAESCAKDTEVSYKSSEKRFLKLALRILQTKGILNVTVNDVDIKFTRNNTDNILTKSQALQTMLEAHMHPEIAFRLSGLFSDPNQAYLDSKPYLQAWDEPDKTAVTPANNKENPNENTGAA